MKSNLRSVPATLRFLALALAVFFGASPVFAQSKAYLDAAAQAAKRGDWSTALTEYSIANRIETSGRALDGIANAHYQLGELVEAYEAYDALYKSFPRAVTRQTQARIQELRGKTGLVSLTVREPDAKVTIDGRSFGLSPVSAVFRVTTGRHAVRATKEGYEPLEQTVEVSGDVAALVDLKAMTKRAATETTGPRAEEATEAPKLGPTPLPAASGETVWDVPHGSKSYAPLRTSSPPKIDGILDEEVWGKAVRDSRFLSARSKPYGQPTPEPTTVQLAYDREYLYVAFRCAYSSAGPRDDSVPPNEITLVAQSEAVGVVVDSFHDHANARNFIVGRTGARADLEITDGGSAFNVEWRGIWDSATKFDANSWTAEIRIPWGTLGLSSTDGPVELGINFRRRQPLAGEFSYWSLQPPGVDILAINFFGHLTGMTNLRPAQRLFVQPYVAVAFDQDKSLNPSRLTDFTGSRGNARIYGGFYARYRPPGIPLQIDATMNPDFSAVSPDQAIANLDRFELSFPEARPFFSEDRPRFEFGSPSAQLFYSRRVGLQTDLTGVNQVVPIIYGTKGVLRSHGTEVAVMNVELSTPDPRISFADNVSVVRLNHAFGHGARIGNIFLIRQGQISKYLATGVDGAYALFDEHLTLSGFIARSVTEGAPAGATGEGSVRWSSDDYVGSVSYLDVGKTFDPQLGFFPLIGARSTVFYAAYTPVVRNDLVQQIFLESTLDRTRDQSNNLIFDRVTLAATAVMLNGAYFEVKFLPSVENVAEKFPIAGRRITIPAGRYDVLRAALDASTAPRSVVVGGIGYSEGDLFGGYSRIPSASLGLNLGRYTGSAYYSLFLIHYGAQDLTGHQLRVGSTISYTALARSTVSIEANTLTLRSVVQLVNSYTFGTLSTVALVLKETTGANFAMDVPSASSWSANPNFTATLSFAYGLTPF